MMIIILCTRGNYKKNDLSVGGGGGDNFPSQSPFFGSKMKFDFLFLFLSFLFVK
jgi:hypothetical protein